MFCWQLVPSLCSCSNSSWSRRTGPWSKTVVVLITNITLRRDEIWHLAQTLQKMFSIFFRGVWKYFFVVFEIQIPNPTSPQCDDCYDILNTWSVPGKKFSLSLVCLCWVYENFLYFCHPFWTIWSFEPLRHVPLLKTFLAKDYRKCIFVY